MDALARIDAGSTDTTRAEPTERVAGYLDAVRSRCDSLRDQLVAAQRLPADLERRLPPRH